MVVVEANFNFLESKHFHSSLVLLPTQLFPTSTAALQLRCQFPPVPSTAPLNCHFFSYHHPFPNGGDKQKVFKWLSHAFKIVHEIGFLATKSFIYI